LQQWSYLNQLFMTRREGHRPGLTHHDRRKKLSHPSLILAAIKDFLLNAAGCRNMNGHVSDNCATSTTAGAAHRVYPWELERQET
jgi:hypothetical protein